MIALLAGVMDDHVLVCHGIIGFLDRQPDMKVIGEAGSGRAAILNPQVAARLVQEMRGGLQVSNPFIELIECERKVLLLVTDGLSNAEIAEKLIIGLQAAKGYISNILTKYQVDGRARSTFPS